MENESFNAAGREDQIKIAEHFLSIQGEGASVGCPSVFLRLSFCSFSCVWCDTVDVWKGGSWFTFDEVDAVFRANYYYTSIRKGAHLIITGGDPMLQQEKVVALLKKMGDYGEKAHSMFIEVETQGAILPSKEFSIYVRQWNVSPKLANSGMPLEKRIKRNVLEWHVAANSWFKFPVASQKDLDEVDRIVVDCKIRRRQVLLMPICSTKAEFEKSSLEVVRLCKMSGFRYSPRLQLALFDRVTGV